MGFISSRDNEDGENSGNSGGSNGEGSGGNNSGNSGGNNSGNSGGNNSGNNGGSNGGQRGGHNGGGNRNDAPTSSITLTESDVTSLFLSSGSQAKMVNDMAPIVSYSAGWDFSIVQEASKPPPGHTFHSTSQTNATVFLPFEGTQIYVFGLLPPGSANVSADYSVDGGPPQNKQLEASTGVNSFIGNATLFVSNPLKNGNHTISIVVTEAGDGRNFTLDYFQVVSPKPPSQTDSKSGSDPKPSPASKTNVGAIVGGVLGVFAFFLILALFFFLKRRRKLGQSAFQREHPQMMYYGQSSPGDGGPWNAHPYPFAPTFNSQSTSHSHRSWPISDFSRFPPPSIDPPTNAPSAKDDRQSRASVHSVGVDSAGSWRSPTSTKNSSMEAGVSHFSQYSSQKTVSTMQFREPTPPARPRVPPTLQPLEPVPQGDFDRFTTASSVRGLGHAL